jgi:predicted DNA-binding antitoxin AbrB/MazE fold protein
MKLVYCIFENGVFRPTEEVDVPEGAEVEVEYVFVKRDPVTGLIGERLPDDPLPPGAENHPQYEVLKIMSHRYNTGRSDLSERHNEHQP